MCLCICVSVYLCVCLCVSVYLCVCLCVSVCVCVCLCVCVSVYVPMFALLCRQAAALYELRALRVHQEMMEQTCATIHDDALRAISQSSCSCSPTLHASHACSPPPLLFAQVLERVLAHLCLDCVFNCVSACLRVYVCVAAWPGCS